MATEYNANLIIELYSAKDVEQAIRISDEMASIEDPIFPRIIYEAYKRFQDNFSSHYFVSYLTHFKTTSSYEIIKEIAHSTKNDRDIVMLVDYLREINYFDQEITEKIKHIFKKEILSGDISEYELENYYSYLEKSGTDLENLEDLMKICFEDDRQEKTVRRIALKKLLKMNPTKNVKFYYENYSSIKGSRREIILVEEISTWHGGIIPAFHNLISKDGTDRAKEILNDAKLKKESDIRNQEVKEQEIIKTEFETADVIRDIATLRSRINKISNSDERLGFQLFLASEEIYQQNKPAKEKAELRGYLVDLRSMIGAYSKDIVTYSISEERALELIPNLKDFSGSINKFHLLLLDKSIQVDPGFFGLRNLNRIITKFAAHPGEESKPELIESLKAEDLFEMYMQENWSKLHRSILIKYKEFLERLEEAIIIK